MPTPPTQGFYPLLTDPPFVCLLLILTTALGRRGLVWLRIPSLDLPPLEKGLLAAALGLGLLPLLFFGLALVRQANVLGCNLLLLTLAITLWRDIPPVLLGVLRHAALLRPRSPLGWALTLALLVLFPLAAAPVIDYDGQFYHLTVIKRWLEGGSLRYLPTVTMSQWPLGVEFLFAFPLALWSDTAAKVLHYGLGVLTIVALVQLGRMLGSKQSGLVGAAVLVIVGQNEFKSAYIDLGIAFQTAATVLTWLLWRRTPHRGLWFLMALLCGFTGSFKLTGIFLGPALFLASLRLHPIKRNDGLGFLLLMLLPVAPYLIRSAVLTGNPVYPLLANLVPTRDWYPELTPVFRDFVGLYNWGSTRTWDTTTRQLIRGGFVAAMLVSTGLLMRRPSAAPQRPLLAVVGGLFSISLALTGPYQRYLLPLLPLVVILAFPYLIVGLQRLVSALALVGLLLVSALQLTPIRQALPSLLGGPAPREAYLVKNIPNYGALRFINQVSKPGERVLLVDDTSYYCDRECFLLHPYLQGSIRLIRYDDFLTDVRQLAPRYVVLPRLLPEGHQQLWHFPTENHQRFGRRLAEEHGTRLYQDVNFEVYRLSTYGPG